MFTGSTVDNGAQCVAHSLSSLSEHHPFYQPLGSSKVQEPREWGFLVNCCALLSKKAPVYPSLSPGSVCSSPGLVVCNSHDAPREAEGFTSFLLFPCPLLGPLPVMANCILPRAGAAGLQQLCGCGWRGPRGQEDWVGSGFSPLLGVLEIYCPESHPHRDTDMVHFP